MMTTPVAPATLVVSTPSHRRFRLSFVNPFLLPTFGHEAEHALAVALATTAVLADAGNRVFSFNRNGRLINPGSLSTAITVEAL